MGISDQVTKGAAQGLLSRGMQRPALAWLGRPFSRRARLRLAIHADLNRITFAQLHPFLHEAEGLWRAHGTEVRLFDIRALWEGPEPAAADVVLVAPWFTLGPDLLARGLDRIAKTSPAARISFIDSFAHNDLRLAPVLAGRVRHYFKKSLFRDRSLFLRAFHGTQLQDYYGALYGIEEPLVAPAVPEGFLDCLRLSPGFFMAPGLRRQFRAEGPPPLSGRVFDLHVRLETRGSPWYQAMRRDALQRALALPGLRTTPQERVSQRAYDRELRQSRLCLSPFGYGELCWRDVEALAAGAVLIKPDMGHLETLPELFEAGVTYLPVKWDFSDLAEVVDRAMTDKDLAHRLAENGYRRIATYLREGRFVTDMACLSEA